MEPKVTIVIPTYKRADRLSRAIDSALNQTYKNIEIIVVDDNEFNTYYRHETEKVMENYASIPKVIYLKHPYNKNGAAARNTGIQQSTGKYITFLDDDDELLEKKIEYQVNCLEKLDKEWAACYTGYKKINMNNRIQYSAEKREGSLLVEALMRSLYLGSGSNLMVRKEVVDEINGFDESFIRNQDLEFLIRILEKYKLAYVNECLFIVHYEIRETNRTFDESAQIDKYYISKFETKIKQLNKADQNKVYSMIYLDLVRKALLKKEYKKAADQIIKNKINIYVLFRYLMYLLKRLITRKSYGFKI